MKKSILSALAAAATILLAASCTKQGTPWFQGNYTFKTSGTISVCPANGSESTDIALSTESGQMDIITTHKKTGSMIVTMNIVGGSVVVFDAIADGKSLDLDPAERQISISLAGLTSESFRQSVEVTVSGDARRYGNTVIFYLDYTGSYTYLGVTYDIVDSDIKCVAKLN